MKVGIILGAARRNFQRLLSHLNYISNNHATMNLLLQLCWNDEY